MKQKQFGAVRSITQFMMVLAICTVPVNAQNADISLLDILQAVQKKVDFLKEHLSDLISTEEITVEEFNDEVKTTGIFSGKTTKTTNIVSEYRLFPEFARTVSNCRVVSEMLESLLPVDILREERTLLSVKENNKTQKIDRFTFDEPFWTRGSSYINLLILFDKQSQDCFDYQLRGTGKIGDRNVYEIGIKQKEADIGETISDEKTKISWKGKYEGLALIDAKTMDILQLTRDKVNIYNVIHQEVKLPAGRILIPQGIVRYALFTRHEYTKMKINDQFLTLPVTKTVELYGENEQIISTYKYRYSDHKVFYVDTKITVGEMGNIN